MATPPAHYEQQALDAILGDICKLIFDVFKLIRANGCHPPCYCPGTMILTTGGEKPVEALSVGDSVITASGRTRPIRWIGRRSFDIARHAAPSSVRPVRVEAGAFGQGLPRRDLVLSPGHSVFVEDTLIPIRFLVNGATIVQDRSATTVTYYHVELDAHDILLAEGLPAESYLDTGNRHDFENADGTTALSPLFEARAWTDTCVPLVKAGPTVERVKQHLVELATGSGFALSAEPDLHVLADGARIEADLVDGRHVFALPADCADIRLVSRTWMPAHVVPNSQDDRELGVCVESLDVDGAPCDLAAMTGGWHRFDRDGGTAYRWTAGAAALPARARTVSVALCGTALYWSSEAPAEPLLLRAA